MKKEIKQILEQTFAYNIENDKVAQELLDLFDVNKRYYWLKACGNISNMWDEEDHKKYISEQDIKDAEKDGWSLIQIYVCQHTKNHTNN